MLFYMSFYWTFLEAERCFLLIFTFLCLYSTKLNIYKTCKYYNFYSYMAFHICILSYIYKFVMMSLMLLMFLCYETNSFKSYGKFKGH